MNREWLRMCFDRVDHAGNAASDALGAALASLRRVRDAGARESPSDIAGRLFDAESTAARQRATDAYREYERAYRVLRATVLRSLVDDDGLTLSDAGRRMSISRQMATRLYRSVTIPQE